MRNKERAYGTVWNCETCDIHGMTHEAFKKHAIEVHNVKKEDRFSSRLVMALDGSDWFTNTTELTRGDLKFTKTVTRKRDEPWTH